MQNSIEIRYTPVLSCIKANLVASHKHCSIYLLTTFCQNRILRKNRVLNKNCSKYMLIPC